MKVSPEFILNVKKRIKSEYIVFIVVSIFSLFIMGPLIIMRIWIMDIEELPKLLIIFISLVFLAWTTYRNTQTIQLLKNIVVEFNESNDKLEVTLYSGKKMIFDRNKIEVEKFSWSLGKEKYDLTDGRMILFKNQKYFIPDSEL
jgi:hypothetical protein